VEEAERQLILKTLASTNNNKTRAAEILQISLKTLHNKLKEYGAIYRRKRLATKTNNRGLHEERDCDDPNGDDPNCDDPDFVNRTSQKPMGNR